MLDKGLLGSVCIPRSQHFDEQQMPLSKSFRRKISIRYGHKPHDLQLHMIPQVKNHMLLEREPVSIVYTCSLIELTGIIGDFPCIEPKSPFRIIDYR